MESFKNVFSALSFAATQHRYQRRKGFNSIPYINHPICVAEIVVNVAKIDDSAVIQAALLHDVVEDTNASFEILEERFGKQVSDLVKELTDDTHLSSSRRKQLQVETASNLSDQAKIIRVADKICNIQDLMNYPMGWTRKRKLNYVHWSEQVFEQCKGMNDSVDNLFKKTAAEAMQRFQKKQRKNG